MRVYAKCISGQADIALRRIEDALKVDHARATDTIA